MLVKCPRCGKMTERFNVGGYESDEPHNCEKKENLWVKKLEPYLRIFTVVAMWFFIFVLLFAILEIKNNIDLIRSDTLSYGMKAHNFTSCTCFDIDGKDWVLLPDGGFRHIGQENPFGGVLNGR